MYRTILVLGANGQLAFDLIRVLARDYRLIKATHDDFDICDQRATERFTKKHKPDIVINTAAFHNTTECELDPKKSFNVNAVGAYNVARAASEVGAQVVFMSTDYVFDGAKRVFYEDDMPNPLNVYGASKLAGEVLTRIGNPKYYIIRTSGLFGVHQSGKGHNFVTLMLAKAKNGESIRMVNDQFSSLTYTWDLALKIKELIENNIPAGIYHVVNSGFCSWYRFAEGIFKIAGVKANLSPINAKDWPSKIKRPKYGCLRSKNLRKVGIKPLRPWQDAVGDYVDKLDTKRYNYRLTYGKSRVTPIKRPAIPRKT